MSRPKYCREIDCLPDTNYFQPREIVLSGLKEIIITLDEFEAIRLADFMGLYQEQAALNMNISRQTFGRIIESAHKKVADALVNGKALRIEGGEISIKRLKSKRCPKCHRKLNIGHINHQLKCPNCENNNNIKIKKSDNNDSIAIKLK